MTDHEVHTFRGPETETCVGCHREAIVCPECHRCTLCVYVVEERRRLRAVLMDAIELHDVSSHSTAVELKVDDALTILCLLQEAPGLSGGLV